MTHDGWKSLKKKIFVLKIHGMWIIQEGNFYFLCKKTSCGVGLLLQLQNRGRQKSPRVFSGPRRFPKKTSYSLVIQADTSLKTKHFASLEVKYEIFKKFLWKCAKEHAHRPKQEQIIDRMSRTTFPGISTFFQAASNRFCLGNI